MENVYLKVQGKADSSLIKEYDKNSLFRNVRKDDSVLILVVDYSEFEIPKGQIFNFIEIPNKPIIAVQSQLILISIFQKEIDFLPNGHKALVAVRFMDKKIDGNIFPTIKEYGENTDFIYISTQLMD